RTLARIEGCLRQGGRVIFMKGPACDEEIEIALTRFGRQYKLVADQAYRIGQTAHRRRLVVFQRLDAPPRSMAARAAQRHPVVTLASEQNSRFKHLKRKLTGRGLKKSETVLMAGARQVNELLVRHPQRCQAWLTHGGQPPPPDHAPAHLAWWQLADPLFQVLDRFGTRSPLLLFQPPDITAWSADEGFPPGCSLLVPFQDPENIGAVIRSAAAFGVVQVILLAESAHPYHPKALRAAGGMTPNVVLRQGPALHQLSRHLPIIALSAEGGDITQKAFPPSFGLLAGLEGKGLPDGWRKAAVRIPILPAVESLNAATATAIALFEWRRHSAFRDAPDSG
ncbi:MAG: RNA methyltransferase, partial [Desulfatitalea sp.]|nr:RNA methyltransferase [Desulfatitalea sp.]NNJ99032.1 RNA methyltransferase [Desulfatitalea sp.]